MWTILHTRNIHLRIVQWRVVRLLSVQHNFRKDCSNSNLRPHGWFLWRFQTNYTIEIGYLIRIKKEIPIIYWECLISCKCHSSELVNYLWNTKKKKILPHTFPLHTVPLRFSGHWWRFTGFKPTHLFRASAAGDGESPLEWFWKVIVQKVWPWSIVGKVFGESHASCTLTFDRSAILPGFLHQ